MRASWGRGCGVSRCTRARALTAVAGGGGGGGRAPGPRAPAVGAAGGGGGGGGGGGPAGECGGGGCSRGGGAWGGGAGSFHKNPPALMVIEPLCRRHRHQLPQQGIIDLALMAKVVAEGCGRLLHETRWAREVTAG